MRGRSRDVARSFRARTLSPYFPEAAAARATGPAPQGRHVRACSASNGSDGGRADRRSLTRIKQVRGRNAPPPSDLDIETKKPAADISARANQTRLDDVSMPVFCPTCQTSWYAFASSRCQCAGDHASDGRTALALHPITASIKRKRRRDVETAFRRWPMKSLAILLSVLVTIVPAAAEESAAPDFSDNWKRDCEKTYGLKIWRVDDLSLIHI